MKEEEVEQVFHSHCDERKNSLLHTKGMAIQRRPTKNKKRKKKQQLLCGVTSFPLLFTIINTPNSLTFDKGRTTV